MSNPPPPSKNRENQDAATLTQSQPSTLEEVEARAGHPRQVGDPVDQADQATDEDVAERARPRRAVE